MKKEDFKIVKGIAIVANLSATMFICWLASIVYWIIEISKNRHKEEVSFYFMLGFLVLFLASGVLNIIAVKRMKDIKLDGTAQKMKDSAILQSKIIIFPIIFAITMNSMRKAMWDWYISQKMNTVSSPVERVTMSLAILEELNEDGYVSQMEYDKRKGNLEESLVEAKDFEKKNKIEEANNKKDDEPWV